MPHILAIPLLDTHLRIALFNIVATSHIDLFKCKLIRGTWVAQSVRCPTYVLAQVMISWVMRQSPAQGSTLSRESV